MGPAPPGGTHSACSLYRGSAAPRAGCGAPAARFEAGRQAVAQHHKAARDRQRTARPKAKNMGPRNTSIIEPSPTMATDGPATAVPAALPACLRSALPWGINARAWPRVAQPGGHPTAIARHSRRAGCTTAEPQPAVLPQVEAGQPNQAPRLQRARPVRTRQRAPPRAHRAQADRTLPRCPFRLLLLLHPCAHHSANLPNGSRCAEAAAPRPRTGCIDWRERRRQVQRLLCTATAQGAPFAGRRRGSAYRSCQTPRCLTRPAPPAPEGCAPTRQAPACPRW